MTTTPTPPLAVRIVAFVRRVGAPSDYPAGGAIADEVAILESSLAAALSRASAAEAEVARMREALPYSAAIEAAKGMAAFFKRHPETTHGQEHAGYALDRFAGHLEDLLDRAALSAPEEKCAECGCPRGFACHNSPDPDFHEFIARAALSAPQVGESADRHWESAYRTLRMAIVKHSKDLPESILDVLYPDDAVIAFAAAPVGAPAEATSARPSAPPASVGGSTPPAADAAVEALRDVRARLERLHHHRHGDCACDDDELCMEEEKLVGAAFQIIDGVLINDPSECCCFHAPEQHHPNGCEIIGCTCCWDGKKDEPAPPPLAATAIAEASDALHPNGRCTCAGEGRCAWCKGTEVAEVECSGCEQSMEVTDSSVVYCEGCMVRDGGWMSRMLHAVDASLGAEYDAGDCNTESLTQRAEKLIRLARSYGSGGQNAPPLAATAARSDLFPAGSTVEPTRFGVRVNIPAAPESAASAGGETTAPAANVDDPLFMIVHEARAMRDVAPFTMDQMQDRAAEAARERDALRAEVEVLKQRLISARKHIRTGEPGKCTLHENCINERELLVFIDALIKARETATVKP